MLTAPVARHPCSAEPLNGATQDDFRLHTLKQRRKRLQVLSKTDQAEPMALSVAQRHQLRRDGSPDGQRKLKSEITELKQRTLASRRQRRARDERLNRHKRAPFLSRQKDRFYHPLAVAPRSPGPGSHSDGFTASWQSTRAPKFGASSRLPPDRMKLHSGLSAFVAYAPDLGPGSYTPDLTATVPDGRPRTTGEVMSRVLSPATFGYTSPTQVRAEACSMRSCVCCQLTLSTAGCAHRCSLSLP